MHQNGGTAGVLAEILFLASPTLFSALCSQAYSRPNAMSVDLDISALLNASLAFAHTTMRTEATAMLLTKEAPLPGPSFYSEQSFLNIGLL
jgi:hypothetical protein